MSVLHLKQKKVMNEKFASILDPYLLVMDLDPNLLIKV